MRILPDGHTAPAQVFDAAPQSDADLFFDGVLGDAEFVGGFFLGHSVDAPEHQHLAAAVGQRLHGLGQDFLGDNLFTGKDCNPIESRECFAFLNIRDVQY